MLTRCIRELSVGEEQPLQPVVQVTDVKLIGAAGAAGGVRTPALPESKGPAHTVVCQAPR